MPIGDYNPSPKPHHGRNKPSRRQRSEIPPKEVKRLKERSGGVCERCDRQRATDKAHVERRQHSTDIPTSEDFLHLCNSCHVWADGSRDGRDWLLAKQAELRSRK